MSLLHWILTGVNLVAIVTISLLLKQYLPKYLERKAENLATKEDIGAITKEIESVKTDYSMRLERLRNALDKTKYMHQKQFNLELAVYRDLWKQLVILREATGSLRPIMDNPLKEGEREEQRKQERGKAFFEAYNPLNRTIEDNRPFYAEEIWAELRNLSDLTWAEAVDYRFSDEGREWEKYWLKQEKNMKAISEQTNKICDLIRTRISHINVA